MKKDIRFPWRKKKQEITIETPQNEYYENISANLGILQVILYFSLFAFVVLSFLQNTNLITYQNFYYFFKDLNASAETVDVMATDSVTYPTNEEQSFTLYRKGLAVAGNTSVTVFTATGRQTVSEIINYHDPVAVGSGKYLLVYELGGTHYSVYNSYTQIHTGKSDEPILGAAVSDSGMYALISSSEEYSSVVSLYSSHFSLLNRYNKNGYVMDISIHEKGKLIAILTSSPEDGLFETKLELYEPGKGVIKASAEIGSSLALSCSFTSSGMIGVLCSDGVSFVTQRGEVDSFYGFDGKEISDAVLNEDGIAICLSPTVISEKNHIIVFDKNGKMLYNERASEAIEDIARCGETVYLLSTGKVYSLNVKSGEATSFSCNTDQRKLLAVSEREALLCSPQKAEYVRFAS